VVSVQRSTFLEAPANRPFRHPYRLGVCGCLLTQR
jgi:hypothetical protein